MKKIHQKWLIIIIVLVSMGFFGCSNQRPIPRSIKNIKVFTRLYGYVKYFHPSDESSKIDWDRFAVYGVKKVEKAKNSTELKKILEELFLPIAPSIVICHSREGGCIRDPKGSLNRFSNIEMKLVAWQHFGVRLSDHPGMYNSIRLNRKSKISLASGFGNLMKMEDATPYRGKEFLYKAAVKVEKGKAQLWFRVDRPNRQTGFFDNMGNRPIQSNQWKVYEIRGKIAQDARNIAYGCFLLGSGKIFADDFQLFLKEGNQWVPVEIINPGFEGDSRGSKPKNWWVRGISYTFQVISSKASKGNKSFMIESKALDAPMLLFPQRPSVGENINKELGMGLSCIIPLALYGTETNTYPLVPTETFENLANAIKEEIQKELTAKDLHVRWADVVITWNIFQHFYPYFDVVKVDWNDILTQTLQKVMVDKDEQNFLNTLQWMVAQLHDGHGNVYHPLLKEHAVFPFKLEWIEDQVVITFSKDKQFKRGDIILSLDGKDAEEVMLELENYISGSPQWKRWQSLTRFGYGERGTIAQLKIRRGKQVMDIDATRNYNGLIKEFYRKGIEELKDNIFYVDLEKTKIEEIDANINRLANAKGVIFDVRGYVTFGRRSVISYLIDRTVTSPIWNIPQTIYPDRENIVYTDSNWTIEPKKPKIGGKVVFLTQGSAISASETFMGIVEHYKLGEIVGQPTAATNGNVNPFNLPGGYLIFWTGMRVLKHDHSQHHLVGIKPTVLMKRTLKGVEGGRDEFLEKAITIINKGT